MIPKRIISIWIGKEIPWYVERCIKTHKIEGYEHLLITNDEYFTWPLYVQECFDAQQFAKAADYLRMFYLEKYGGIYLDADVTVLKNFDDILDGEDKFITEMFVCQEKNGYVSNAIVGSMPHHPILQEYLRKVETNFIPQGDMVFEPGMYLWTEMIKFKPLGKVKIYNYDWFLPYDHQTGFITPTPDTHTFHHYIKSWMKEDDILPTVSILIPTRDRPEGLNRCINSIDKLLYPKHLIEVIMDGRPDPTVPQKIDDMYKMSHGKMIVYAADDMEFTPLSLYNAVKASSDHGLVSFNAGEVLLDAGNICEHFLIRRDLIERIGGQIFDTEFYHVGVDNLLWARADKLGEAIWCSNAIIIHHHFSKTGAPMDSTYERAWKADRVEHDRKLLKKKLAELT